MDLPTTRVIRNEKMQSMHACSTGGERRVEVSRPLLLGRHIALGQRRARAEDIFLHIALDKKPSLGVDGAKAILVDEHGLVLEPHLPRLFRDVFEDALAEGAGVGRYREAFGLSAQLDALL